MRRMTAVFALLTILAPAGATAGGSVSAGTRTAEYRDVTGGGSAGARAEAHEAGELRVDATSTGEAPAGAPVGLTLLPMLGANLADATAWRAWSVPVAGPATLVVTMVVDDIRPHVHRDGPANAGAGGVASIEAVFSAGFSCAEPATGCTARALEAESRPQRTTRAVACADGSCAPLGAAGATLRIHVPDGLSGTLEASAALRAVAYVRGTGSAEARATGVAGEISVTRRDHSSTTGAGL